MIKKPATKNGNGKPPDLFVTCQLVRGLQLSSRTIGYFGAGYYSHIDVLTPKGLLRGARSDMITPMGVPNAEPILAGVQDRPQNYEKWAKCTRYSAKVTQEEYQGFWSFSDAQLGKPYDTHGLLATFVFGRAWREDDSWWCSELFAMCGEKGNMWTVAPETLSVTPGDCAFLMQGRQSIRREMPV